MPTQSKKSFIKSTNSNVTTVTIKNFRCHLALEVEIDNGFTHLKGLNGRGKTTLLEAIKWCLYGGRGGIAPYPHLINNRKVATIVEMSSSHYKIFRKNSPAQLIYTDQSGEYRDMDAQHYINVRFGAYPLWSVSQRKDHLLMTAADSLRHESIMSLIFPGNCARLTIDTAKMKHKSYQADLAASSAKLKKLENILSSTIKRYHLTSDHFRQTKSLKSLIEKRDQFRLNLDEIISTNAKIEQFQSQLHQLQRRVDNLEVIDPAEVERLEAHSDNTQEIQAQVAQLEGELSSAKMVHITDLNDLEVKRLQELNNIQEKISNLKVKLTQTHSYSQAVQVLDDLREKYAKMTTSHAQISKKLSSLSIDHLNPLHSDLSEADFKELITTNLANEKLRSHHYSQAVKIGLNYDFESISSELKKLKSVILQDADKLRSDHTRLVHEMELKLKIARELPTIKEKRATLLKELHESHVKRDKITKLINSINLDELRAQKDQLSARYQQASIAESYKTLTCPHCHKECGLHKGELVAEVPISEESSAQLSIILSSMISRINEQQSNLNKYNRLLNNLNGPEAKIQADLQILNMEIKKSEAKSNIEVDGESVTSLSRKLGDHDRAIAQIHKVRAIKIIEVLNLKDDIEERRIKSEISQLQARLQTLNLEAMMIKIEAQQQVVDSLRLDITEAQIITDLRESESSIVKLDKSTDTAKNNLTKIHTSKISKIESDLATLKANLSAEINQSKSVVKRLAYLREVTSNRNILEDQLRELRSSPLNESRVIGIADEQSQLRSMNSEIKLVEKAKELRPTRTRIRQLKVNIDELNRLIVDGGEMLTHLQRFKYVRIDSYFRILSNYCNQFLEVVLKDENMLMSITTDKKLKSGKTKNVVHINILKNNDEVDYNTLNGGHQQIISLIITLSVALSRPGNVQFIFLDEILTSLSSELRDRCLNLFRGPNLNKLYSLMQPLLEKKKILLVDHPMRDSSQILKL